MAPSPEFLALTEGWVDYLTGPWGFAFAFAAGLLSFLSPCVLPLVPAYLAHLTGTTANASDERARVTTVTHAISFVLGFTVIFTLLGASVGLLGHIVGGDSSYFVRDHQRLIAQIGGVFLIVMGLNLAGVIRIPLLYRTYSFEGASAAPRTPAIAGAFATGGAGASGGSGSAAASVATMPAPRREPEFWLRAVGYAKSFGVGSVFALGWTPCIGPVLGAILTLSATTGSVARGAYLLLVYSAGLGVPFIITGLAVVPVTAHLRRMRGLMPLVEILSGVLVIFVGALIFLDKLTIFNSYFSDVPFLDKLNQI